MEDDITASAVVPASQVNPMPHGAKAAAYKFAVNCEYRLFQRPDDAVHRGLDRQTERDMARPDNFLSNFEPLTADHARALVDRVTEFDEFSPPMTELLRSRRDWLGTRSFRSASPTVGRWQAEQKPALPANPPGPVSHRRSATLPTRDLRWHCGDHEPGAPCRCPSAALFLIGRRNNPPDRAAGIRPLAVYNPIHYQELPEFFMDVICSLTGKSPSTTGAGSEGALTKGPFNALQTIVDLNAAFLSYVLTGLPGFSTAAGFVGPARQVDHDISLLVPEVWCRLSTARAHDPAFLIREGLSSKHAATSIHGGEKVLASRLGYRITAPLRPDLFSDGIFDHPDRGLRRSLLASGNAETSMRSSTASRTSPMLSSGSPLQAFDDGSVEIACPPLRALLSIMAHGNHEGKDVHHPDVRRLFTRESVLTSDWYGHRLAAKQRVEERLWRRHLATLDAWLAENANAPLAAEIRQRRALALAELDRVTAPAFLENLVGALGVDPSLYG